MFSAAEKIRHEQLKTVEDERKAKKESDDSEEEEEDGDFHSPRQSFFTQQPLVRPSIRKMPTAEKVEDGKFRETLQSKLGSVAEGEMGGKNVSRPCITSRLLR